MQLVYFIGVFKRIIIPVNVADASILPVACFKKLLRPISRLIAAFLTVQYLRVDT